jgi:ribosome-interacting GTPase 1
MDLVQTKCKQIKCKSNCKIYQITIVEKTTTNTKKYIEHLWNKMGIYRVYGR